MLIIQQPEGLLFEKNISDIVLQKQNDDDSVVSVEIKIEGILVISETYKYDANGFIYIRRIDEIVSPYLIGQKNIVSDKIVTRGFFKEISVEMKFKKNIELEHVGIDYDDQLIINENSFSGSLSTILSIGDLLYKIGDEPTSLLITAINDQTYTIDFNANVSPYVNIGEDVAYFSANKSVLMNFAVIKCEAEMPVGLNAGTFVAQNFLTRLAREKRTATNQNEYLSYMHFDSYAEVIVKYKAVYDLAGVRTEKTGTFLTIAAQAETGIITFNASLSKLRAIAALPDEYIYQYDIWFTEATTQIDSNVFSFLVVDVYYRNRKYFVFENSFGVLETFTATGRPDVKKNNEINLANIQSRYRKTTQDFTAETTINTGFLSESEMEWLDDLILSYNVAIYIPGITGSNEEITLTTTDKTDTDANELQAFSFSYRRAKNNHLQFTAAARGIFDNTFDQTFN